MIAGDDDDVAGAVGAAHDADMAAVLAARQHDDRADPRAVDALAVVEERFGGARIGCGVAGAAQDEVDEVRAPQIRIRHADLPRACADPFQRLEADGEDQVFLVGRCAPRREMAVLSVRCVGGVAELRTNRSSFFSPMANAGEQTAAAVVKTRSV